MDTPDTPEQESRSGGTDRRLGPDARIILWSVVAVGVLVAVAAVFTFVQNPPLDVGTPEGVVQRYLQAVINGRRVEARSYLSDRLQRECDEDFPRYLSQDAFRIEWIDTVMDGSVARVEVRVVEQDIGIFDPYYEFYTSFTLEASEDGWRITDQKWPWYRCSESPIGPEGTLG